MPNLSLAIIDSDSDARNHLTKMIGSFESRVDVLSATAHLDDAMRLILESKPHIVILGVGEIAQGARDTSAILASSPETAVFVTCKEKDPDWILRLVRAGAGEYLTKPVLAHELVDAIAKVARNYEKGSTREGSGIAVYHPAGGVGTTTIAVNLAVALAAGGEDVALVDLNAATPDIATFLDLAPRYTLSEVIATRELDASFLKGAMVSHPSRVQVLAGPVNPAKDPDRPLPEQVQQILKVLTATFKWTVVDTGGELSRGTLAAFHACDRVLYPTVLNLTGLKNARHYLGALDAHGYGPDKVKLVVNKYGSRQEIDLRSADRILRTKPYVTLPDVYSEANASLNRGEPLIDAYPRSSFTKAVHQLAERLKQDAAVGCETNLRRG